MNNRELEMSGGKLSDQIIRSLAEEVKAAGQQKLLPPSLAEDIAEGLLGSQKKPQVVLFYPLTVNAELATAKADLSYMRCPKCGKVYDLKRLEKPVCEQCGVPLVPAPIWAISGEEISSPNRFIASNQEKIKLVISVKDYTSDKRLDQGGHPPKNLPWKITVEDKSRPIASLKFEYKSTDQHKSILHNPSPIHKMFSYSYIISLMPSESITKPVTITAFAYRKESCTDVKPTAGSLSGIEKILYCRDLEVLQATPVYRAGHPRVRNSLRVSVYDYEEESFYGGKVIWVPARYFQTRGLVIKAENSSLEGALKKLGYREDGMWTALHTISHAFLVNLPQITGLEGGDFGEAISSSAGEVAVYDNSPGGLGGIEGVVDEREGTLKPNYEWSVRESHKCPLACTRACKACLFTESCFMLNWNLDRRILIKLGW